MDRLLETADEGYQIVGALAFQLRHDDQARQHIVPTMYLQERGDDGQWLGYREIETFGRGLIEVDATGTHCLLVHRSVFEKVDTGHPHRWFHESVLGPGMLAGEDITFCLAAREAGFKVVVNTTIESGHVKPLVLTSAMTDMMIAKEIT